MTYPNYAPYGRPPVEQPTVHASDDEQVDESPAPVAFPTPRRAPDDEASLASPWALPRHEEEPAAQAWAPAYPVDASIPAHAIDDNTEDDHDESAETAAATETDVDSETAAATEVDAQGDRWVGTASVPAVDDDPDGLQSEPESEVVSDGDAVAETDALENADPVDDQVTVEDAVTVDDALTADDSVTVDDAVTVDPSASEDASADAAAAQVDERPATESADGYEPDDTTTEAGEDAVVPVADEDVTLVPDAAAFEPDAIALEPDALALEPDAIALEPDAVALEPDEPAAVSAEPYAVADETDSDNDTDTGPDDTVNDTGVDDADAAAWAPAAVVAVSEPARPGEVAEARIAIWAVAETDGFRERLGAATAQFVDDPSASVTAAAAVVSDAVAALAGTLQRQHDSLDPRQATENPDTEALRVAIRAYRDFLERVLAL